MHATRNALSGIVRAQSIELLNKHPATAIDLNAPVRQAHRNVRGSAAGRVKREPRPGNPNRVATCWVATTP